MNNLNKIVPVALVVATVVVAVYAWNSLGGVTMSTSGYVALILGIVATLALAVGLMGLLFYSHNKGYDDDAGRRLTDDDPR